MNKFLKRYMRVLPDGRTRIDIRSNDGVRYRKTFLNRTDAIEFVRTILLERDEEQNSDRQEILAAINEYEDAKRLNNRPATIKRNRPIFEYFRQFVLERNIRYLEDFTPRHADELFHLLVQPRKDPKGSTDRILTAAPKTVNMYFSTYKSFFKRQVNMRHLTFNPLSHIEALKVPPRKPEYFTKEEQNAFFEVPMSEAYRRAFLGYLHTGMRFDELANLRWVDVDFETRHVQVTAHDDFKPKTHKGERKIPMNKTLHQLLLEIKKNPFSDVWPFSSPEGSKLRERKTLTVCVEVAAKAGIKRAFIHKFRHTFATMLVQKGVSLEKIQVLLGHANISETQIYAHNIPDSLHNEVGLLD